jgi:hypothetical protein
MAQSNDVLTYILAELPKLVRPLVLAGLDERTRDQLFESLGWELEQLTGFPVAQFNTAAGTIAGRASTLAARASTTSPESLADIAALVADIGAVFDAVRAIAQLSQDPDLSLPPDVRAVLAGIGRALVDFLVVDYLRRYHPLALHAARLLTLVELPGDRAVMPPAGGTTGHPPLAFPAPPPRVRPDRLEALFNDPAKALRDEYLGAGGLATEQAARDAANRLYGRLAPFLAAVGALVTDGTDVPGAEDRDESRSLAFGFPLYTEAGVVPVGAVLEILSDAEGGAALVISPTAWMNNTWPSRYWVTTLATGGQVGAITLRSTGATVSGGAQSFSLRLAVERRSEDGTPATVIGAPKGTRLEVGALRAKVEFGIKPDRQEAGLLFEAEKAAIVISTGDADGFLQKLLPPEGVRVDFDLAIGWSNTKGLYLSGGAGLEATLPVNLSLFGVINIDSIYLGLRADQTGMRAIAGATTTLKLGPLTANVERFGLQAVFAFPAGGGNLGPANLQMTFKPPDGAALVVDAGVIAGGGYLFFDTQKEQYAGILQLALAQTVAIKAVGLLTTRMPDGSRGFSLLVILTAEGFAPIQLGFGFKLTGIGGLLGVNRTASADALRSGIKTGTLGSILFPVDPVRNAQRIVSDVGTVFPPAPDRYVFGPMVMIEWGTPTLLTLEIGVVLEVPEPVRLLILGRLKATLPDEKNPLVQIRMDALGVIDFGASQLSLDATLYDSRLLSFVLTGDMAMRVNWGRNPNFLLAIGGWNPRFNAPAGFPRLSRLALTLSSSDDARLRLESYLAVTSNTLQFGARVDFYFAVKPFSVEGNLGFDALINFSPFSFIADLSASVALRMNGAVLLSVRLNMTLSGPSPWHIWGTAQFSVLFFKQSISFDARFGADEQPALPDPVNVRVLLANALCDARNWSSELPAGERPLATFRAAPSVANVLRVHPLAEVAVRERVVPLDRAIAKFGNAPVTGAKTFALKAVRSDDGREIPVKHIDDSFALAQFVEMSDDQKLAAPAFTQEHAGIRFTTGEFAYGYESSLDAVITYETLLIVAEQPAEKLSPYTLSSAALDAAANVGAAAQAASQRADGTRLRLA